MRDYSLYLEDILTAILRITEYTSDIKDAKGLTSQTIVLDAVVRNLQIIGEAAKNISKDIKDKQKDIEWQKIVGFRDISVHAYFQVNSDIVWDIIKNKLPSLNIKIKRLLEEM
jgi:uncharacterized protein with HEPN domain